MEQKTIWPLKPTCQIVVAWTSICFQFHIPKSPFYQFVPCFSKSQLPFKIWGFTKISIACGLKFFFQLSMAWKNHLDINLITTYHVLLMPDNIAKPEWDCTRHPKISLMLQKDAVKQKCSENCLIFQVPGIVSIFLLLSMFVTSNDFHLLSDFILH